MSSECLVLRSWAEALPRASGGGCAARRSPRSCAATRQREKAVARGPSLTVPWGPVVSLPLSHPAGKLDPVDRPFASIRGTSLLFFRLLPVHPVHQVMNTRGEKKARNGDDDESGEQGIEPREKLPRL